MIKLIKTTAFAVAILVCTWIAAFCICRTLWDIYAYGEDVLANLTPTLAAGSAIWIALMLYARPNPKSSRKTENRKTQQKQE